MFDSKMSSRPSPSKSSRRASGEIDGVQPRAGSDVDETWEGSSEANVLGGIKYSAGTLSGYPPSVHVSHVQQPARSQVVRAVELLLQVLIAFRTFLFECTPPPRIERCSCPRRGARRSPRLAQAL